MDDETTQKVHQLLREFISDMCAFHEFYPYSGADECVSSSYDGSVTITPRKVPTLVDLSGIARSYHSKMDQLEALSSPEIKATLHHYHTRYMADIGRFTATAVFENTAFSYIQRPKLDELLHPDVIAAVRKLQAKLSILLC